MVAPVGSATNGTRAAVAVGLGVAGLFVALVIGCLTFMLSGGGHGWNSSLVSGLAGLVLLPAFGVGAGLRGTTAGRIVLALVVAGMLAADAAVASLRPTRPWRR